MDKLSPADYQKLNKIDQDRYLTNAVLKELFGYFKKTSLVVLMVTTGMILFNITFRDLLEILFYFLCFIMVAVVSMGAVMGLWIGIVELFEKRKKRLHKSLMGRIKVETEQSSWSKNKGVMPKADIVHVQHLYGKVVWRVAPEDLNWSLDIEDPITEYLEVNR